MHLLKIVLVFSFLFCISLINAQHSFFSTGPYFSSDFNFYKFSDGNFRDDERKDKTTLGFTVGGNVEFLFSKRFALNAGVHFSKKHYTPERLFGFGVLSEVKLNTIEFPFNLKYYFNKKSNSKFIPYTMIGLIYQLEKDKKYTYTDIIGSTWKAQNMKYRIPAIALGLSYAINNSLSLQGELSYRYGKCHGEYLNERIDKIGIGLMLKSNL